MNNDLQKKKVELPGLKLTAGEAKTFEMGKKTTKYIVTVCSNSDAIKL